MDLTHYYQPQTTNYQVLSLTMKPFKEFATDLKQNDGQKFAAMYKYIMTQKNMSRIQSYIIDSLSESKEIEDRKQRQ